jgi:hypothetical protein
LEHLLVALVKRRGLIGARHAGVGDDDRWTEKTVEGGRAKKALFAVVEVRHINNEFGILGDLPDRATELVAGSARGGEDVGVVAAEWGALRVA